MLTGPLTGLCLPFQSCFTPSNSTEIYWPAEPYSTLQCTAASPKPSLPIVLSSACTPFLLFIIMLKTKLLQRNGFPMHLPSGASQGKGWWEYAWTSQGKLEAVSETWPEMVGPSGTREASTVINPDEDKWTGPIRPPCGGVSSTEIGGPRLAGWMTDTQLNCWPAGLEVGWEGLSTDWVAWVSIYPEQGSEIKWSCRGRAEGIGMRIWDIACLPEKVNDNPSSYNQN